MSDVDEDGDSVPHDCIWRDRAESAESKVSSLTASLATRTEERDSYLEAVTLAESEMAELRKRMEIARLALEKAEHGLIVTHNLDASDDPERGFLNAFVIDNSAEMKAVEEALALIGRSSGPGPAPVESKPCPHSTCAAMHDAKGFHRPAAAPSSAAPDAGKEKA